MKSCLSSEHKHDFTGKCINMNYTYDLFDKMLMREERNLLGQLYHIYIKNFEGLVRYCQYHRLIKEECICPSLHVIVPVCVD